MNAIPSLETLPEFPELEHSCQECAGKGGQTAMYADDWEVCSACMGAGYIPTDFGRKVLALMRHQKRALGITG